MHPEATHRLGHALQACLSDELTRSAAQRQLSIVPEAMQVALGDLVVFVDRDMKLWQGRLIEGPRRQQQEEGARTDQLIAEHLRRLGYE